MGASPGRAQTVSVGTSTAPLSERGLASTWSGWRGETASLVIPSALGHFETSLEAEAKVGLKAEALALASWGKEGGELKGVAVAGAFAEASLALPVEVEMAGVRAKLRARASGYAGAGLKGAFDVRFDPKSGRLHLSGDLGAVLGVGGGVGISLEVDARALMARLGLIPPSATASPSARGPPSPGSTAPATPAPNGILATPPGGEERLLAPPPPRSRGAGRRP